MHKTKAGTTKAGTDGTAPNSPGKQLGSVPSVPAFPVWLWRGFQAHAQFPRRVDLFRPSHLYRHRRCRTRLNSDAGRQREFLRDGLRLVVPGAVAWFSRSLHSPAQYRRLTALRLIVVSLRVRLLGGLVVLDEVVRVEGIVSIVRGADLCERDKSGDRRDCPQFSGQAIRVSSVCPRISPAFPPHFLSAFPRRQRKPVRRNRQRG